MITIKMPEEITKYEAKLVGPFTSRQCIVLLIFLPMGIGLFNLVNYFTGSSTTASYACIPIGGIAYLFGWLKPYGHPFEKFLKSVFVSAFIAPSKRIYRSQNYFDELTEQIDKTTPEEWLLIDAELANVPPEEIEKLKKELTQQKKKKKKKTKSEKYQKSKKAIF